MSMARHESYCLKNPLRKCRTCESYELTTRPMPELVGAIEQSMAKLTALADGCPECIMATIIQTKAEPNWREDQNEAWVDFDYKAAHDALHSRFFPPLVGADGEPAF